MPRRIHYDSSLLGIEKYLRVTYHESVGDMFDQRAIEQEFADKKEEKGKIWKFSLKSSYQSGPRCDSGI